MADFLQDCARRNLLFMHQLISGKGPLCPSKDSQGAHETGKVLLFSHTHHQAGDDPTQLVMSLGGKHKPQQRLAGSLGVTKEGSHSGSLKESKSTSKEQIPSRGKTGGEKLSTDLGVSENRRDEGVLEPV